MRISTSDGFRAHGGGFGDMALEETFWIKRGLEFWELRVKDGCRKASSFEFRGVSG